MRDQCWTVCTNGRRIKHFSNVLICSKFFSEQGTIIPSKNIRENEALYSSQKD
jgi:hypothetical protein